MTRPDAARAELVEEIAMLLFRKYWALSDPEFITRNGDWDAWKGGEDGVLYRGMADALLAFVQQREGAELKEARDAIAYLFTPGPGIAVPEPYPEQECYEPHKATWNKKLGRLRSVLATDPDRSA